MCMHIIWVSFYGEINWNRVFTALGRLLKILTDENKSIKNQKASTSWGENEAHKRRQIISSLKVCCVLSSLFTICSVLRI